MGLTTNTMQTINTRYIPRYYIVPANRTDKSMPKISRISQRGHPPCNPDNCIFQNRNSKRSNIKYNILERLYRGEYAMQFHSILRTICPIHNWKNHCRIISKHIGCYFSIINHFNEFWKISEIEFHHLFHIRNNSIGIIPISLCNI